MQIWSITQDGEDQFKVTYMVDQLITEGENKKTIRSAYTIVVYVDSSENIVITKNPTICSLPVKSGYEPKAKESDRTVDVATTNEIYNRSDNQVTVSLLVKYLDI